MHLLFRLLPVVVAGGRLGRSVLMWVWVGCSLLALLCWLPWFELTAPWLTLGLTVIAYFFTVTGLGPGYFAQRTTSEARRQAFRQLTRSVQDLSRLALRALLVNIGLAFIALFIVGWGALVLFAWVALFIPSGYADWRSEPLFERGHQQLVLRDDKAVILWPIVSGFNFVTHPAIEELDATWTAVPASAAQPDYVVRELAATQARLLAQARQARLDAATKRRTQAQQQARLAAEEAATQRLGYDELRFEVDKGIFSWGTERSLRAPRLPLDSTRYGWAKLSPAGTLRFVASTSQLGPLRATDTSEDVLRLALTQFAGPGTYRLQLPKAGPDTSTLQLRHYEAGVGTTFASRPSEPPLVEITRFDPKQRLVAGTFAGRLFSADGQAVYIENGRFALRYAAYRPPRPTGNQVARGLAAP